MSLIGKKVEPFTAQAFQNGEFFEVTENDLKGHWSVICFYPSDFSFVCPTELEDLQSQYAELQKLGVEVFSVSTDTHFVHKAWHDESPEIGKIQYTMVGDPSHVISRNFDVLDEEAGLAQRGTFILSPEGIVQSIEISADSIGRDASVLINKVKAGQYIAAHPGQVCPAKWQEGEETLTPSLDLVGKL
ncbi:MAG: peroxiredoxin [Lactobacillales bacterium]|jgi:peroxiredoxin (alkyl hydroperoxide reductase subunit C)|nr:peroxiredoxin [Lactobacillales bacterium]